MMEIGQNDGGGDKGEQWEYDIARTHTHTHTTVTSYRSRYMKTSDATLN